MLTSPQRMTSQLNPNDLPSLKCVNCGSELFIQMFHFKKISELHPLAVQAGGAGVIQLSQFNCFKCGANLEESLASSMQADDEQREEKSSLIL